MSCAPKFHFLAAGLLDAPAIWLSWALLPQIFRTNTSLFGCWLATSSSSFCLLTWRLGGLTPCLPTITPVISASLPSKGIGAAVHVSLTPKATCFLASLPQRLPFLTYFVEKRVCQQQLSWPQGLWKTDCHCGPAAMLASRGSGR